MMTTMNQQLADAHAMLASELESRQETTFCRLSGVQLFKTEQVFSSSKITHASKHWIFNQKLSAIEKIHASERSKTHQQRSLLALAFILSPETGSSLINLAHPAIFPSLPLKRNYTQIIHIARKLAQLNKTERKQLAREVPSFTSNAIVVTSTSQHTASWQTEALIVGQALITYICDTLYPELVDSYDFLDNNLDDIDQLARLIETEMRAKRKPDRLTPVSEYWNYILEEVQTNFDLGKDVILAFREQLKTPTNSSLLEELRVYCNGMKRSAEHGKLVSIPAIQFKNAVTDINIKLAELQFSLANFDLEGSSDKDIPTISVRMPNSCNKNKPAPLNFKIAPSTTAISEGNTPEANKYQSSKLKDLMNRTSSLKAASEKRAANKLAKVKQATNTKFDLDSL